MNTLQPLHIPNARERKIRIMWLMAAVVVISIPHLVHISPWIGLLLATVCIWRYMVETRNWSLPSTWVKVPLVFIGLTAVALTYRRITGVEAGTALLLTMLALKILETKSARDLTVVSMICWFLMFAVFLREQQLWAIAYIFIGVGVCMTALVQIQRVGPTLPTAKVLQQTGGLLLQALPLMLVLFFLFPRLPAPIWALSTGGSSSQTGLSDSVNPGDISELSQSNAVAFRVRFKGAIPPPDQRYWRGPVMGYFNGRSWSWADRGEPIPTPEGLAVSGSYYDYEVVLEPHGREWLLALETPAQWSQKKSYLSADLQLVSQGPIRQRIAYTARSYQTARKTQPEVDRYLQAMTYITPGTNPDSVSFAEELRNQSANDREYLNKILSMFREQQFYYTLRPPKLGKNSVDEFLFSSKQGFCEHYASAFATLARAAGIPARLVTGYLGGELNPLSNDFIVRQSDAHAWTEVWLKDRWVRVDPTAAVAPERIELGLDGALANSDISVRQSLRSNLLISQAILSVDAVNAAWNRWVLAFGPDTQKDLLSKLGIEEPDMRDMILIMAIGISLLLAALAFYLRTSIQPRQDPLQHAYKNACKKLARVGVKRKSTEGPVDFACRAGKQRPADKRAIDTISQHYVALRYAQRHKPDNYENQLKAFIRLTKNFKPGAA
jgi:transglutaminase-like putative cysteine protease